MVLRRCAYDSAALHVREGGAYWYRSGWHPAGLTALTAASSFSALTCDSELWTGPLVAPLGGADLTLLGAVVSALAYVLLAGRSGVRPARAA
ncbi:allantoin permease [Streptomyces narbonensis]